MPSQITDLQKKKIFTNLPSICILSAVLVIVFVNSRGSDASSPAYMKSKEDNSTSNETTVGNEKFHEAHKKTLDFIWVMKCYVFDAREQYRRVRMMDGNEIQYLHELFDALQSYLDLLGDIVERVVEKNLQIKYWDRITLLNETIVDKLLTDWKEIKQHVDVYKPIEAVDEYKNLCKAVDDAIEDLPKRYKPIYEYVMELQNSTQLTEAEKAELHDETTKISLSF